MSNVLNDEKRQQVTALGRLGWSLRRIERAVHIRRETIAAYLRAAGIAVRPAGAWGRAPAKPANEVITDPDPTPANPANEVITDFGAKLSAQGPQPTPSRSASASAPFRDAIELGLLRGRNAMAIWQDLVDSCGFTGSYQSVQRFVHKLRPGASLEACAVIETAPGEECQVDYGTGPMVRDPVTGKLVRKPGAFASYRYREHLFPASLFRKAYDLLREVAQRRCDHRYLEILELAAKEGEARVENALRLLLQTQAGRQTIVNKDAFREFLDRCEQAPAITDVQIADVSLASFDQLFSQPGALQ